MPTTSELIIDRLLEWGIDTYFGLAGDGINGFFEALRLRREKIRFVHVRHEEAGALAAVGYAKFTGRPAVCVSTAGPGALHLINGLYDAKIEGAPLIAITGMPYHDMIGTHFLQDINQDYLFNDACEFNQRVNGPAHAVNVTDLAVRSALAHRAASHLAIAIDVQSWEFDEDEVSDKNVPGHTSISRRRARDRAHPDAAREGRRRAARPAQGGDHRRRGRARRRRRARAGGGHPRRPDREGGARQGRRARRLALHDGRDRVRGDPADPGDVRDLRRAADRRLLLDLLRLLARSPARPTAVQIDDRAERIGLRYPVEVGLVGDAKATLAELAEVLERNEDRSFLEHAQAGMRRWWELMDKQGTDDIDADEAPGRHAPPGAAPGRRSDRVRRRRDDDDLAGRMKLRRGQRFSFSGTNCSMAASVPYAMGAQMAYPDAQVVAFVGDGALSMLMGDLATLAQHQLPVKVVVINNFSINLILWEQMAFLGNPEFLCDLSEIDFAKVADGCGIKGIRVTEPGDCRAALEQALAHDGPALVDCVVDPEESPLGETLKPAQAKHLVQALAKGTPGAREKARLLLEEERMAISPALQSVRDELAQLLD